MADAGLLGMNAGAAQFFEGHIFMGDGFDHIRAGDEHVR